MPTLKSNSRRRYYSLLEIMAAMVLLAFLTNMALHYFYDGSRFARKSANKANTMAAADNIKQWWRELVHERSSVFMLEPDKIIFDNRHSVIFEHRRLVFSDLKHSRSFALPEGTAATFGIEKNPGELPCAVLWLSPAATSKTEKAGATIRIVAVMKPEVKP